MAASRHDDNDGSDIFWPGYVDATTNLILNLLFLLTILIVAVFMFALELGRSTQVEAADKQVVEVAGKPEVILTHGVDLENEDIGTSGTGFAKEKIKGIIDPVEENLKLKEEIRHLKDLLAQKRLIDEFGGGGIKTVDASIDMPKPRVGLEETVATNAEVLVRFKKEAIDFLPEEREQLIASLRPIVAGGQAVITVDVPAGFSEAKRIGFYRAMAVRNLLMELSLPGDKIEVAVLEQENHGDAALVRVR